jgi:RDD family
VSPNQVFPEDTPANGKSGNGVYRPPAASVGTRIKALLLTPLLIVVTLGVGWLAWSVVEWCSGRTPSYRRTKLRVVRKSDGKPIGLGRSVLREACCALLLVPTLVACFFLALSFALGASPPEGVFGQSRHAPWDLLTRTDVVNEAQHL